MSDQRKIDAKLKTMKKRKRSLSRSISNVSGYVTGPGLDDVRAWEDEERVLEGQIKMLEELKAEMACPAPAALQSRPWVLELAWPDARSERLRSRFRSA